MAARYFEQASHAAQYASFRPQPPNQLIVRIMDHVMEKFASVHLKAAVDVGCGSGQSTHLLAPHFKSIMGVDVSDAQIEEAKKHNKTSNVIFKVCPAETLPFDDNSLQLVTSSQACHWFDMPKFFKEVDRILAPNGVLAIFGYTFPRPKSGNVKEELSALVDVVYNTHLKGMWGKERIYVDERYTDPKFTIPYTDSVRHDDIVYEKNMTVSEFRGYVSTWSGFQKYKEIHGEEAGEKLLSDLVKDFLALMKESNPDTANLVADYPFFLLMGRKPVS